MKNRRGQTLIESLMALLFIGISVVALIRFQNYLAYDNSLSQQYGTATMLALSEIESLRDFQVLNTTAGYTAYQDIVSRSSTFSGTTASYTITSTVSAFTNPTYKAIDVTVSWNDRYGTARSVRQITDVAGIEPQLSAAVK